ncbi:helicase-associated domain-containing protein [Alicyclobacillus sp. SO9]|nr:helicase-associated domain-containing protein [Alicyclobacillus sp. SO9]
MTAQTHKWYVGRELGLLRLCLEQDRVYAREELTAWFGTEDLIDAAVTEGWLFPTSRVTNNRSGYCIPQEIRAFIYKHVTDSFREKLILDKDGPLIYSDEQHVLAQDLDVFLEYVRNQEVTLTQDGAIYKRHLIRLLQLLQVQEETLNGGWRFGYGRRFHDYPDRFALMYDYAFSNRLIEERDDGLLAVTQLSDEWLEDSAVNRERSMAIFYISLYRRAILKLPVIVKLFALTKDDWVNLDSMLKAVAPFVNEYYYDSVDSVWRERIVKMMMHLGLIRIGEDESGQQWFQTTDLCQQLLTTGQTSVSPETRSKQTLIVQPNFNVIATADEPSVTGELARIADIKETGAVRVYRISESSFIRGLDAERNCRHWLTFLEQHSQTPVPGNIEKTLLDWEKSWLVARVDPMTS